MILSETNERKWKIVCERANLNDDKKFKPKKFKKPPKYLRVDQPKSKWIVKPTRLDLLKDAEAILESLMDNRVNKSRRFQPRRRRKKKKKSSLRSRPKPPEGREPGKSKNRSRSGSYETQK